MFKKARRFLAYITAMVITLSLVMPAVPMTAFAKAEVNNEITNVQNVQIEFQKDGQKITNVDIEGGQQSEIDVVIKFRCDVSGGYTQIPIYLAAQMNGDGMYNAEFTEADQGYLTYNVTSNDNEAQTRLRISCNGAKESSSVTINAAVNADHYDKNSSECASAELGINGGGNQGGGSGNAQVSDEFNAENIQIKFRKDGQENTAFNIGGGDNEVEFEVEVSFRTNYHGQNLPVTIPVLLEAEAQGGGVNINFPDANNNMLTFDVNSMEPQDIHLTTRMRVTGGLDGANITVRAKVNATNENQSHAQEGLNTMQITSGGGQQTFDDKEGKYTVVFNNSEDEHDAQALWVRQGGWMVLPTADELGFHAPDGKIFGSWSGLQGGMVRENGGQLAFKPTGRTILTAEWINPDGKTFTVTVNPGTAGGDAYTENVNAASSYTFKNYSEYGFTAPGGYEFVGYEIVLKETIPYNPEDKVIKQPGEQIDRAVKDYTATALWKPTGARECTITYRLGNYLAGGERIVTNKCYAGNKYTLLTYEEAAPILSDSNTKEFAGWTINGTDYAPKAKIVVNDDITVTARERDKTNVTGIALCREAERGVIESKIMNEESNQANAPVVGVTKGSTINYTVKMFTGGTIEDFWYVLTSNEHNDIAKASIKDDVLTITGLKAGETNIAIEASSKNGDTNRQQWFRIVVSEIAEQDTSAEAQAASASAANALSANTGVNLEIDDYNLTCRTGIVASETNTAANIDESLADAVMSNLVGMDDTLSEAEQTALKNGYDTYLYVEAAAQNENQVDQAVKEAMETHMPAGSTVGAYMDIDFYAQIGNSARRAVTDTGTDEGVEISVDTDDFEPLEAGATRSVTVLRYHDGAAEKVDDVTVNGTTATFKTSKFSPYVILFSDFRTTQQPGDVASVTPHYKVLNETTSEWEEHTFTTSYYSDIKEAFTAASDQTYKSEISGLPENEDYFQYYPATIKLLDDAAIENGETCTADANIDIDLNGHTFEIKEGGTLTGGSYANVTIDSETVGTFRSAGTISTEYFSAWTADTYYITGGNITSFFGIDGGNVNISGGTFSEDLMANNGSEADINVNISGTAEFTQFVECMPYGSSSDEPTLRMTISENARIKGLIFGIIEGTAEITTPNLIINGGYFGTDPSTLKSNYPNNVSLGGEVETYSSQSDWIDDHTNYTYRVKGAPVATPVPTAAPSETAVASVTLRYHELVHENDNYTWEVREYTTSNYSSIQNAFAAAANRSFKSEIAGLPEDPSHFQYYPPIIKLLTNVTVADGETLTEEVEAVLDLNGKTFTVADGGTLAFDSHLDIKSTAAGTFNMAGTICGAVSENNVLQSWTNDNINITGGTINTALEIEAGNYNITGGTFNKYVMLDNAASGGIDLSISGSAEFKEQLQCYVEGGSNAFKATISGDARIADMSVGIWSDNSYKPNIIINGGYFASDPSAFVKEYNGVEGFVEINGDVEAYASQTDWIDNHTDYTYRVKSAPPAPTATPIPTCDEADAVASVTVKYSVGGQQRSYTTYYPNLQYAFDVTNTNHYKTGITGWTDGQYQYVSTTVKLLKDVRTARNQKLTAHSNNPYVDLDLNGHELRITSSATLDIEEYLSIRSATPGTLTCAGTIGTMKENNTDELRIWTADNINISGGTVWTIVHVEGGNLNFTGGEFYNSVRITNMDQCDVNANISGTATFNNGPTIIASGMFGAELNVTISGKAKFTNMFFNAVDAPVPQTKNLIIKGGYFKVDPSTLIEGKTDYAEIIGETEQYDSQLDWTAYREYNWRVKNNGATFTPVPTAAPNETAVASVTLVYTTYSQADGYVSRDYSTKEYATIQDAFTAAGNKEYTKELTDIPAGVTRLYASPAYVTLLTDVTIGNGETCTQSVSDMEAAWSTMLDLNGHTLTVAEGGTLDGLEIHVDYERSGKKGTIRSSGTIDLAMGMDTRGDSVYITGGKASCEQGALSFVGGTVEISGGEVSGLMLGNIESARIYGDNTVINDLYYSPGSGEQSPLIISGTPKISGMRYSASTGMTGVNLAIYGGYFDKNPNSFKSGYKAIADEEYDESKIDEYYMKRFGSFVKATEISASNRQYYLPYYVVDPEYYADNIKIYNTVEEYSNQADWISDHTTYPWRVKGMTPAPTPVPTNTPLPVTDGVAKVTLRYEAKENNKWITHEYSTTAYATIEETFAAAATDLSSVIPDWNADTYYDAIPLVTFLKDVTVADGETLTAQKAMEIDLNGQTFTVAEGGTLTGKRIYLDSSRSGKEGVFRSGGTISIAAFAPWSDTVYITGGTVSASLEVDGGRLYISGGTFTNESNMINNGGWHDIDVNIYGNAEFTEGLGVYVYGQSTDEPKLKTTISGNARIAGLGFRVFDRAEITVPNLIINGGYFDENPESLLAGYEYVPSENVDKNNLDNYYIKPYGSFMKVGELTDYQKGLFLDDSTEYYILSDTANESYVKINATPEQYTNQTDWAADSAKYTWRVPYEVDDTVSVSGTVSGSTLTYTVNNAPENAVLIAARYDGNTLTDIKTVSSPPPTGTLTPDGSGDKYKLFLWEDKTHKPLCNSWENK